MHLYTSERNFIRTHSRKQSENFKEVFSEQTLVKWYKHLKIQRKTNYVY
jgi:hypothetical protein